MKVVPFAHALDHVSEIAEVVKGGGLACIPHRGAYRLLADARSKDAITKLAQSKRRSHNRAALVIVADLAAAGEIVDGIAWPVTARLAKRLWPGPVTLVLPPSKLLPAAIAKLLARSTGHIGIRVPDDRLSKAIVEEVGGPILASSANIENKPGSGSAAVVRQKLERSIDIWVDAGDLKADPPSTLVEIGPDDWRLIREGSISRAAIEKALA